MSIMTNNLKIKKMITFNVPTREEVAPTNQTIFDNLNKALGFVPNLYATIAYSKKMSWISLRTS